MDDYYTADEEDCYYSSDHDESLGGIDNDDSEFHAASSKKSTTQVITQESLLAAQREDLLRVMELLSIKEHHARTLLIHYQWDIEKLISVFVEKGKDCLFSGAGVTVFDSSSLPSSSPNMSCDVCLEDVVAEQMKRMDCGHCFCNDCWTEHFTVQINEGQSKRIRCMAHKCNAICDEDVVRSLVSKKRPDLAEKFDRFLVESYIEDNKMVKWCPSTPHCGNAIRAEDDKLCEVECSCGLQFCFSCMCQAHSPCSCLMWELWRKKCRDESETVNWITVHTKLCPKCYKPVEKNGGCNLVRCICGQYFCWLCGGATGKEHTYRSIAGHSCGRYEDDKERQMERAKRDLDRYTHYHHRYKAHTDSSKLEDKLRNTILEKVSNSEKKELKLKDFTWVTNGLNRLFRSRRILSYSYAFAYYMFGEELFKDEMSSSEREMKKNLFEDQQQQLEGNVEKLSQLLEEPFDDFSDDKVMDVRIHVINLSVAVDSLCKKMYECIENDLLGSLQSGIHNIAPYSSKGIEQAAEFHASWSSSKALDSSGTSGETSRPEKASGSRDSEDMVCSSSKKRPRREVDRRVTKMKMISPSNIAVDIGRTLKEHEYIGMVRREVLDQYLRERAEKSGATVINGLFLKMDLPENWDSPYVLHYTEYDGKTGATGQKKTMEVDAVIGADGANSRVAKSIGAGDYDYAIAFQERIRIPDDKMTYYEDLAEMYVGDDVSPDFYGWVFPKCDHVAVGTGTVTHKGDIKKFQLATRNRAKDKILGGKIIRVEAHPIPEHPRPRRLSKRVALVGDAAGYVTKCSGEGIYFAAKSGRMCAEAIVEGSQNGKKMIDESDLRKYLEKWDKTYLPTYRVLDVLQKVFYRSNPAREAFVEMCGDEYVQKMTFDSYLYKRVAPGSPLEDLKLAVNTIGSVFRANALRREIEKLNV